MIHSRFETPQAAERAFYEAFENTDLDAMRAVWAPDDEIVCVHPMGPRLRGHDAVMESWRAILESGQRLRFRIDSAEYFATEGLSVHCVHENITQGSDPSQRGLVIATNAYRETESGWRMVLHHGSPGSIEASTPERPSVVH